MIFPSAPVKRARQAKSGEALRLTGSGEALMLDSRRCTMVKTVRFERWTAAASAALLISCGAGTSAGPAPGIAPGSVSDADSPREGAAASAGSRERTLHADADGDGVPDGADSCPADPEDMDNFEDGDGCPDPDNDEDRIVDADDECPNEPETYNGMDDLDGCPDESKVFVHVDPVISVPEVLHYDSGDPLIKSGWKPWLDQIAEVIIANPCILRVEVAAHTDQRGTSGYNLKLSKDRAEAVVAYLVGKGVDGKILSAAGYGETCPMNFGTSAGAFSKNKRIEFKLLETDKGCTGIEFVCREAVDLGLVPEEDRKYLPGSGYCK
jgi:outer membrane protein OmpA-like peptidoglycan-associated protein